MDCTKPPPKRVVTFALRCSSRMTVSAAADRRRVERRDRPRAEVAVIVSVVAAGLRARAQTAAATSASGCSDGKRRRAPHDTWNTTRVRVRCNRVSTLPARSGACTSST